MLIWESLIEQHQVAVYDVDIAGFTLRSSQKTHSVRDDFRRKVYLRKTEAPGEFFMKKLDSGIFVKSRQVRHPEFNRVEIACPQSPCNEERGKLFISPVATCVDQNFQWTCPKLT